MGFLTTLWEVVFFVCLPAGNRWKGLDKAAFCLSAIKSWGSLKSELRKILSRAYLGLAVAALMTIPAWPQQTPTDLANKSVEDLMNIEVTSVSKKEQKLSSGAAAIFVITQEDIRRSGATNIPDLLRIVPGLDVAQINASTLAISVRGFS